MAPVTATNVGMTPQVVDSPQLKQLMEQLNAIHIGGENKDLNDKDAVSQSIQELLALVEPFTTWRFEEQVRQGTLVYQQDIARV